MLGSGEVGELWLVVTEHCSSLLLFVLSKYAKCSFSDLRCYLLCVGTSLATLNG